MSSIDIKTISKLRRTKKTPKKPNKNKTKKQKKKKPLININQKKKHLKSNLEKNKTKQK